MSKPVTGRLLVLRSETQIYTKSASRSLHCTHYCTLRKA